MPKTNKQGHLKLGEATEKEQCVCVQRQLVGLIPRIDLA
jgi:hypothetical protein